MGCRLLENPCRQKTSVPRKPLGVFSRFHLCLPPKTFHLAAHPAAFRTIPIIILPHSLPSRTATIVHSARIIATSFFDVFCGK